MDDQERKKHFALIEQWLPSILEALQKGGSHCQMTVGARELPDGRRFKLELHGDGINNTIGSDSDELKRRRFFKQVEQDIDAIYAGLEEGFYRVESKVGVREMADGRRFQLALEGEWVNKPSRARKAPGWQDDDEPRKKV